MKLLDKIKINTLKFLTKSVSLTDAATFKSTFAEWLTGHNKSKNSGYIGSCANVWGLSFAKAHFRVYDYEKDNTEIENHPAAQLIKNPLPRYTGFQLKYRIATDLIFEGNSYILKLRPMAGKLFRPVTGLYPLQADRMNTYPPNQERIEYYEYNTGSGVTRLNIEDVIHFQSPDRNSIIKGAPIVSRIADVEEVEKLQTAYRKQFYLKGGFLGATFTTSKDMGKDSFDRMLALLQEKYGGSENAFKVALFDNDIKPVPTAYGPKDMQMVEDRNLNRDEICSAFGVNKLLFGQSENIQRGNADTVLFAFYYVTIDPLLELLSETLTGQLINVDYAATDGSTPYYMKADKLAQRDVETDLKYYQNGLANKWLLPSEVREAEGYEPMPELDTLFLNSKPQAQPAN